jgi:4-hydroxybenzoate polyprenyltransferase
MESTGISAHPVSAVSGLRSHLELMRPANMVTALADILAGFAVGGLIGGDKLPWLLVSGLALYGGGVTMNDFYDRRLDAVERPERPIPSGRVSAGSAWMLGMTLLLIGIGSAFFVSAASATIAAALAFTAIAYDSVGKHIPVLGPLLMGSCRGLDLLLGVSANPDVLSERWIAGTISVAYIAGITLLSTGEVHGGSRLRSSISAALLVVAATGALLLANGSLFQLGSAAVMVALLAWRVGPAFYKAWVQPGASQIRSAIKAGIISLVFLDAAVAAAYQGVWYALGLVALVLVVSRLARMFPVT